MACLAGSGRLLGLACVTGKMGLMMTRVMILLHLIMMVAVSLCEMVAMISGPNTSEKHPVHIGDWN